MFKKRIIFFLILVLTAGSVSSQDVESLDLLDESDVNLLLEDETTSGKSKLDLSEFEEVDDLQSLKKDIGEVIYEDKSKSGELKLKSGKTIEVPDDSEPEIISNMNDGVIVNDERTIEQKLKGEAVESSIKAKIFEVGRDEKELVELAKFVEGKIPEKEWDEIATAAKVDSYVIQEGDWLWKISQRLFGSGFYYSKIWSLNPQITNPHEVEPGMTLVFSTGSSDQMPEVKVGSFEENVLGDVRKQVKAQEFFDFGEFGEDTKPSWIEERKKLLERGTFFQFASDETYQDLVKIGKQSMNVEFEKYEPPIADIIIEEPGEQYDASGFDRSSKITFDVKEGFFLNTFVTSNIVQDLGEIVGMEKENIFIQQYDSIYVKFDNSVKVKPGDFFSIYIPGGKVNHKISDRAGYKYTIGAQVKALRKINRLWECSVTELAGLVERKDRITVYTPKINKIARTFNKRNIEAAVIDSYMDSAGGLGLGDVVYLDRGRADGVEMGTVFDFYGYTDRGTRKRLTPDPTYKIGEAVIITLTDNFSTALITNSSHNIPVGTVALTKTEEQAALAQANRNKTLLKGVRELEETSLDELDVELNLDDISKNLLDKADKVQLTEDELEELERQEREKSIIKDHERDLQELERLEGEILDAEASLNEAKVDEDKFLEQQNLNDIEKDGKSNDPNAFEGLNDIEEEVGLKFLDEDLNAKENPYGLTEFDLEEIDELLNLEKL